MQATRPNPASTATVTRPTNLRLTRCTRPTPLAQNPHTLPAPLTAKLTARRAENSGRSRRATEGRVLLTRNDARQQRSVEPRLATTDQKVGSTQSASERAAGPAGRHPAGIPRTRRANVDGDGLQRCLSARQESTKGRR